MDCLLRCITGAKYVRRAGRAPREVAPRLLDPTEWRNENFISKDKVTTQNCCYLLTYVFIYSFLFMKEMKGHTPRAEGCVPQQPPTGTFCIARVGVLIEGLSQCTCGSWKR